MRIINRSHRHRSRTRLREARQKRLRDVVRRKKRKRTGAAPTIVQVVQQVTYVTVPVGPKIAIVNQSKFIEEIQLAPVAAALARQVNEQLALSPPHGYGIGARIRAATALDPAQPDEWVLLLTDRVDEEGILGYHDETEDGLPLLYVAVPMVKADWTVVASHEVLETLIDPNLDKGALGPDGKWWAYEVCDAVSVDEYVIDGVRVSNFVLPPYFEPQERPGKLDWLGLVTRPLELRPGGYNLYWDGDWVEVWHGDMRAYRGAERVWSRRARRRRRLAQIQGDVVPYAKISIGLP